MQQWYNCPRCSARVAFGSRFCGNCGIQLSWQPQKPPPQYRQANYSEHVARRRKISPWLTGSLALICIVVIVGVVLSTLSGNKSASTPAPDTMSAIPEVSTVEPSQTTTPTPPPNHTSSTLPTPSSQNGKVNFEFAVTDISGSGLSRTITAQVTNTGDIDAHNVWGKVEVFSQDLRMKLEGKEFLRKDIGDIASGDTVTTEVALSFGLTDSLKILQNGATFVLTIYSDELTETFSYEYSP